MDSFEFNKIAGAILGTLVFVMGISFVTELIFHSELPENPGYVIEIAEASTGDEAEATASAAAEEQSVVALLATADVEKGLKVAKKCAACHSFDNGGANKVGPNLWDVVARKAAAVDGFRYSSALTAYGGENSWTYEELDGFLTSPKTHVSGTSMGFAGLKKPEDRANMIAYLRSLSDSPAPLPAE